MDFFVCLSGPFLPPPDPSRPQTVNGINQISIKVQYPGGTKCFLFTEREISYKTVGLLLGLIISDYIQLSNIIFKDVNDWLAVQLWHPGSVELLRGCVCLHREVQGSQGSQGSQGVPGGVGSTL